MNILTHTQKLEKFRTDLENKISRRVGKQTNFSKFKSCKAFLVKRANHNLGSTNWLVEITKDKLIDCCGYEYNYDVLTIEQLCDIGDEMFYINLSKKKLG